MPSRDPEDPDFRRLWYVRYADDWLLGFSGPRHEAEEIKRLIGRFLRETLRLELAEAKTLITHARHTAARFLGYEVVALHADGKHDHRGQRIINGLIRLKVPNDVIVEQCRRYMRVERPYTDPNGYTMTTSASSANTGRSIAALSNITCWLSMPIACGECIM